MEWIGISSHGSRKPCFMEPKSKIIVASYQERVLKQMVKEDEKLFSNYSFIFQQDFTPPYTTNSTIKWFTDFKINSLLTH